MEGTPIFVRKGSFWCDILLKHWKGLKLGVKSQFFSYYYNSTFFWANHNFFETSLLYNSKHVGCVERVLCPVHGSLMAGKGHYHYLWLMAKCYVQIVMCLLAYLWLARDFFLPVRILANMSLEQEGRRFIWNNCLLHIPVCTGNLPDAIMYGKQLANLCPVYTSCANVLYSYAV